MPLNSCFYFGGFTVFSGKVVMTQVSNFFVGKKSFIVG